MGDDSEWQKLPTEEKVQHKVWKARVAGYETAAKLFQGCDEKSKEFSNYAGLVKKFVTDSNAVAQEKGLDAVLAFVENAPNNICARTCNEVITGVVTKCLNASKQKTKEKGMEIVMLYIEAEKPDIVQETLMTGMENKQPKVVIGSIQTVTAALRDFGTKVIQIKPLLKLLPKLLDDRDKNVREETKQLVIEIYRWIGAALKPQMTNFKPIQVQEFEAEFAKLPPGKPVQSRFMRSQQELKAKMEEQTAAAESGDVAGDAEEEEAIDPFDLMTPVDILSQLPKPFFEQIEAKKWQERKEMLEAVQKLSENPRLEAGDYSALMRCILKVIAKDSNVMLVVIAGKIVTGIANGLRKKYQPYAVQSVTTILEKFKEKKATVVAALRDAIDASFQSTNLEAIMEDALASLENKNPSIKAETALFLARSFSRMTQSSLPKKMLKAYCAPLLKTINDTDPAVREASFQALGTAMKVVTEKNIGAFLVDVDNIKMQKIQECCEKTVLLNAKGEPRSGPAPAAKAAAPGQRPASAPAAKAGSDEPKPVKRPGTAKPASGAGGPKKTKAPPPKKNKKAPVEEKLEPLLSRQCSFTCPDCYTSSNRYNSPKRYAPPCKSQSSCRNVSPSRQSRTRSRRIISGSTRRSLSLSLKDEIVEEKAQAFLPGDTIANLASSNWKERLAAMENMIKVVSSTSKDDIPCQVCIRVICKKPGLKETNFQVLKLKLELVAHLARNSKFSKRSSEFCLPEIVDKLGDAKNGGAAKDCLTAMSEALGLDYVSVESMARAFEAKSPKNQQEAVVWLSSAVTDFGLKCNVKGILPTITKALAHTNPGVRSATIALLGVLYLYMGDTLRMLFDNEKPALLQQIDAEFEKRKGQSPPAPTKKMISATGNDDEDDGDEEEKDKDEGEAPVEDLVPRNDISEKITEALCEEMADKNWKVRAEGLQKVTTILAEAKFVKPNLGPLPEALKARLGESNKNLSMTTIGICQTLAAALGPHSKQHIKVIGPGLLACLADSKPALREKVVNCLNAWIDNTTLLPLVESEALFDALKLENPFLKAELLGWLSARLPNHKQLPAELKDCIPFVLNALSDRNADVRKKAGEALIPFMIHTGYDSFLKALGKCKPASKDQIQPLLEKAREGLPAKPVKTKKAAPAASGPSNEPKPVSRPAAKTAKPPKPEEPEEEEEEAPKPVKPDAKAKVVKGKAKGKVTPPSSKKKEEEDFSPTMTMTVSKEQRMKEEKALKVLRWNFLELKQEYVDQLRTQMEKNFSAAVMEDLFNKNDFKLHIKAIEALIKCLETQEKETINNLDLVLKWLTIRFCDTNPSMLNKALDYLQRLFTFLAEKEYHLSDFEANAFVPYFLVKAGDSKDNVRRDVRNILKLICKVFPSSKMFSFLIDGLKSKVSKQRMELLEELGCLIEKYGLNVCQPSPAHALKIIAQSIGDRDNFVRNAALNTIVEAYYILGETVYKYVGNLSDKNQSYLEERIKRAAKNRENKAPKEPVQSQPQQQSEKQRPKTAPGASIAKPPTPVAPRQASVPKTYQLDIEMETWEPVIPSLEELDVDSVMGPVTKPKIMARPASPMNNKLMSSADASTSISSVVNQISAIDINTCIKALAQIDEVMKDAAKVSALCDHVDNLLVVITMQTKLGISKHLVDANTDSAAVVRLYRCLLSTLLSIFDTTRLGKKASTHTLKDLMQSLLTVLLDTNFQHLPEGRQIIQSVNLTVVQIINKSDPTNITCAHISLMREGLLSETCSNRFMELVTKCLWKNLNLIDQNLDELNCDRLLYESHLFLQQFPTSSVRARPGLDLPIRTIKTLLHSLTKLKGHKILSHTGLIPAGEKSEVENYLHVVLAKTNCDGASDKAKSAQKKRVSKTHELLTDIFKKIGTKENTREGLNDLFDFKKKYPEADMNPFLKKTAPGFQKYISNMLAEIEEERRGGSKSRGDYTQSNVAGDVMNDTVENDHMDVDFYREKLRVLRAKCGLDSNTVENEKNDSSKIITSKPSYLNMDQVGSEVEEPKEEKVEAQPEPPRQPVDVSNLKARLERIKKMANS